MNIELKKLKRLNHPKLCSMLDIDWDKNTLELGDRFHPIIGKDGFYYDRINKICWVEYNGIAYEYNYSIFMDNLNKLSKRMRNKDYQLLSMFVFRFGIKSLSESKQKEYEIEKSIRESRYIYCKMMTEYKRCN